MSSTSTSLESILFSQKVELNLHVYGDDDLIYHTHINFFLVFGSVG